ncbi:MAG: hypothetical protein JO107_02825, partial [Hyphomicrobiales bacterium]|nr:hypothetical protein [Hyphomicrobiales bacterium]MBV8662015.1 hypothetical protein [Hyphomicrobiales bacterium]
MNERLYDRAFAYAVLRDALMKQYDLDAEDETLLDTLEGATDLHEALARAAREAQRREAMADAMGAIIKDNQERKARHVRAA